jgi:penicillin-binding protein 1C
VRKTRIAAAALLAAAVLIAALCDFFLLVPPMPSFDQVKARYQPSEAVLLDRNGKTIHVSRKDMERRRLGWVRLDLISPCLRKAVIMAEDRRFARHHGVDWPAFASAFAHRPWASGSRGASTITMQLASHIDAGLRPRSARRTWLQKWGQMKAARSIERSWTKDQIFEAYLNVITFSGELQGIASASQGLFGKDPSGLDTSESLLLASLIPSYRRSPERIAGKACSLGSRLGVPYDGKAIRSLAESSLGKPCLIRPAVALAPHVAAGLLTGSSRRVSCSLDKDLQAYASEILKRSVGELNASNVRDGAILVADNATGEILAYVGNTGESSSARYVDGVRALRQAGSTLKPFLYGLALEKRLLTASSIVLDEPLKVMASTGIYQPEDYSRSYLGPVSVRTALASSLNTPAVRTLMLVGCGPFVERLKGAGFESIREDPEFYGYSLALGTVDVSLFELVQGYMALADGGLFRALSLTPGASAQTRQVMGPEASFIISSILSDRESRSATFGFENYLSTRFWTAAKTGTSKDMRDNWCIGYSQRYTVGVWVGNFSGEPMWNVSGVSGAAPVWMEIMNYLHRDEPSAQPSPPPGVMRQAVRFAIGEQTRAEWFIQGTEPVGLVMPAATAVAEKSIAYPPDGATIALDPDIPGKNQAVCFQADPPAREYRWLLDGKPIGRGYRLLWKPSPGRFTLSLAGQDSQVYDRATFTVK